MVKVNDPSAMVPGDQASRNVGGLEQLGRKRIDRKRRDEQRHTAVGKHRADGDHGEHGVAFSEQPDDAAGDRFGKPRNFDQLAEQRAEQKHRKVGL